MNLDKNQIEAVRTDEKTVLVIAAPGSGYHYFIVKILKMRIIR